ncbi:MAG: hypothetical protein JNN30_12415 [Rhodanobacteraceae bacterium]|nr:hypothetical protein [Rhodanobacteraceae bacterium]
MKALQPTRELLPGAMMDVYRIRDEIGRGGMGIVCRADGEFWQSAALKWLPANLFDASSRENFR